MKSFVTASLAIAATLAQVANAQQLPPKPHNRAEAVAIVRELRRIVSPNGIERATTVRIGGIDQFITIRGEDRRNPVLVILHGGPGFVETPAPSRRREM